MIEAFLNSTLYCRVITGHQIWRVVEFSEFSVCLITSENVQLGLRELLQLGYLSQSLDNLVDRVWIWTSAILTWNIWSWLDLSVQSGWRTLRGEGTGRKASGVKADGWTSLRLLVTARALRGWGVKGTWGKDVNGVLAILGAIRLFIVLKSGHL